MKTVEILAAIFVAPFLAAFLFALWDDTLSPRHRRHVETIERMERETDASWDAYCDREGLPASARSAELRKRARAR